MADAASDPALELARNIHARCELWSRSTHNLSGQQQIDAVAALLRPHVWAWIPVGERLPEFTKTLKDGKHLYKESDPVLVHDESHGRRVAFYESSGTWSDAGGDELREITHWATLPSAPLSLESSDQK